MQGVHDADIFLGNNARKRDFWNSILNSSILIQKRKDQNLPINRLYYYSFFKKKNEIIDDLRAFVSNCTNSDEIDNTINGIDFFKDKLWAIILPWSIIGGYKWFIISEPIKQKIIDLINHYRFIVNNESEKEFNNLIEEKRENFNDINNNEILFDNILLIIRDNSQIYNHEKTFLKLYKQ